MPNSTYTLKQIVNAFRTPSYYAMQKGTLVMAILGVFGHITFYLILKYQLHFWESIPLRLMAILAFLSLLLLPRDRAFNNLDIWRYELVIYFTGPVLFTIFLFQNDFNLYWSIAFFMSAVVVGGLSAPAKSIWLFPISVILTTLVYSQFHEVTNKNLGLLFQITLSSFFTYILVTTGVIVFSMVYKELEEKNTIIKKNREKMMEQKAALEKASNSKSMFLANMSHEIRTPLNAIIGFSQILLDESTTQNFPKESKKLLNHIKNGGEHLADLISNVLDLSKIESDKMEIFEEEVNLKKLIDSVFHLHENSAYKKGLVLKCVLAENLPDYIKIDRVKLNQILINVIANAIKFSEKGDITLAVRRRSDKLEFKVSDQGIGISKELQQVIFDSFEQEDNTTTRKFGGSGLGLSITQRLLMLLGGKITVESTQGIGSVFTIAIPMKEIKTDEIKEELDISTVKFTNKNRVLVVEDDRLNCIVITKFLESFGITTLLVNDGQQAIDSLSSLSAQNDLPDLVLMDLHMPVLDGQEATVLIKKDPLLAQIPIVALTADASSHQMKNANTIGFADYLTKPISKKNLFLLLKQYLD